MTKALKASAVAAVVLAGNCPLRIAGSSGTSAGAGPPLTRLGAGLLALCVLRGRVAHCNRSYRA